MAQAIGERRAPFGADLNRSNQLPDRRSFLQFLGLADSSSIPGAKTIWLFSDRLAQAGLRAQLFDAVQQQLLAQGYPSAQREADLNRRVGVHIARAKAPQG